MAFYEHLYEVLDINERTFSSEREMKAIIFRRNKLCSSRLLQILTGQS